MFSPIVGRVLSEPEKRCEYDRNGFTSEEFEKPCVELKVGFLDLFPQKVQLLNGRAQRAQISRWIASCLSFVYVKELEGKGRGVVASRELGMGEVILSRERPFAAVLSSDESAYKVSPLLALVFFKVTKRSSKPTLIFEENES